MNWEGTWEGAETDEDLEAEFWRRRHRDDPPKRGRTVALAIVFTLIAALVVVGLLGIVMGDDVPGGR